MSAQWLCVLSQQQRRKQRKIWNEKSFKNDEKLVKWQREVAINLSIKSLFILHFLLEWPTLVTAVSRTTLLAVVPHLCQKRMPYSSMNPIEGRFSSDASRVLRPVPSYSETEVAVTKDRGWTYGLWASRAGYASWTCGPDILQKLWWLYNFMMPFRTSLKAEAHSMHTGCPSASKHHPPIHLAVWTQ